MILFLFIILCHIYNNNKYNNNKYINAYYFKLILNILFRFLKRLHTEDFIIHKIYYYT